MLFVLIRFVGGRSWSGPQRVPSKGYADRRTPGCLCHIAGTGREDHERAKKRFTTISLIDRRKPSLSSLQKHERCTTMLHYSHRAYITTPGTQIATRTKPPPSPRSTTLIQTPSKTSSAITGSTVPHSPAVGGRTDWRAMRLNGGAFACCGPELPYQPGRHDEVAAI